MKFEKDVLNNIYYDIKNNQNIREDELAEKYLYSTRTIRRYIRILKDNELIQNGKKGKKHYWIIK